VAAVLDPSTWTVPGLFALIQREGSIEDAEMFRTFNMGVGIIAAVDPARLDAVLAAMPGSWRIGEVVAREGGPPSEASPSPTDTLTDVC
jgi:phosphoribosylformylglycinamidine cyclo-ligase